MEQVKTAEGIMEILAAYDLTESYRDAAKLAGCDHRISGSFGSHKQGLRMPSTLVNMLRLLPLPQIINQ